MTDINTAYAVVVTAVSDPTQVEGLEWERAVEYLPSLASHAMRTWVRAQESETEPKGAAGRHGVVIPGPQRRVEPRQPYREVCVPPSEYLLFSAAVRQSPQRGVASPGTRPVGTGQASGAMAGRHSAN
ncbi:hypothetical protein OHB26_20335 [Nocardia sp. NBC_01503]|uniref:hypothetical protein n=1 Tax=Nocardia sp. NBC_01503 TaxID=2975997 RepID=UPI002E7B50C8|nr:hypothetical protein [Nocardia sp. NBC_01503]WTL29356.1 hypothetical protein OHB26_20335 [Nocardia sp. NBC_01503]